ncbi:TPA: nucleotidyltransferase domain-containing protein, partial [Legionella pneumophila]|nr:nucleotidyltransferase domain-containing protein [Legionella pneumophila]
KYLETHDPETLSLFDEAITNIDNLDALNRLITRVIKIDKT